RGRCDEATSGQETNKKALAIHVSELLYERRAFRNAQVTSKEYHNLRNLIQIKGAEASAKPGAINDCSGSFTSLLPSRPVRFAPRADIRPMPAFMSTRPTAQPKLNLLKSRRPARPLAALLGQHARCMVSFR